MLFLFAEEIFTGLSGSGCPEEHCILYAGQVQIALLDSKPNLINT
jgi:hypothetical protein